MVFDFPLRPYQQQAIEAVEARLAQGRRRDAGGHGHRHRQDQARASRCSTGLLNAKRFRRVLFRRGPHRPRRADRRRVLIHQGRGHQDLCRHLRPQGAGGRQAPEPETKVHICTVQGMVRRVLYTDEPADAPPVDQYDCIVVDECHRGYLLDRELSDAELSLPRRGGLHLEVSPGPRAFRRGQGRADRHAGAAHRADLRRPGLHLQLPRGRRSTATWSTTSRRSRSRRPSRQRRDSLRQRRRAG